MFTDVGWPVFCFGLAVSIAICLPCLFLLVGQVNCCWLAMFIFVWFAVCIVVD